MDKPLFLHRSPKPPFILALSFPLQYITNFPFRPPKTLILWGWTPSFPQVRFHFSGSCPSEGLQLIDLLLPTLILNFLLSQSFPNSDIRIRNVCVQSASRTVSSSPSEFQSYVVHLGYTKYSCVILTHILTNSLYSFTSPTQLIPLLEDFNYFH